MSTLSFFDDFSVVFIHAKRKNIITGNTSGQKMRTKYLGSKVLYARLTSGRNKNFACICRLIGVIYS
jgi:hypothetical protein